MMRKAKVEFHYARDGRNPVRYPAGADVPVLPEHVDALVVDDKIEGEKEIDPPTITATGNDEPAALGVPLIGRQHRK